MTYRGPTPNDIVAAKGAQGVVVRVGISRDHAGRHALMSALFNAAAAKDPRGIAVEKQAQEHRRGILLAAGASRIDPDLAQVPFINRIQDEVAQVVGGDPCKAPLGCPDP